jgi:thymidylate synthase
MEEGPSKHPDTADEERAAAVVTPLVRAEKKRKHESEKDPTASPQKASHPSARRDIFNGEYYETEDDVCDELSTDSTGYETSGNHSSAATPCPQQFTQPVDYLLDCSAGMENIQEDLAPTFALLEDTNAFSTGITNQRKICKAEITIGRHVDSDLVVDNLHVSRLHCTLRFGQNDSGTCILIPNSECWVEKQGSWERVTKPTWEEEAEKEGRKVLVNKPALVSHNQRFRLIQPGRAKAAQAPGVEYRVYFPSGPHPPNPGSHSADTEYLRLLRFIHLRGHKQTGNKKGSNVTLPEAFNMVINLSDKEDRNLLPYTTLRYIKPEFALLECLWYLRGEEHIQYLQDNKCPFWNKQVKEGTTDWIGLNYGLLTNYPQNSGRSSRNQLEEEVLKKLADKSKCSRNMVCTLVKPGEETTQGCCTSSIQFTITPSSIHPGEMALDLNVNQRSSDVVVGLPHDLVVWSLLLHLVRREVLLRYNRKIYAGKLTFSIGSSGAHYYSQNKEEFDKLLLREPKDTCQPYVDIMNTTESMFDLAKKERFDADTFQVLDYNKKDVHPPLRPKQAV